MFSQEKYIRKKQLKYLARFQVLRPTLHAICEHALAVQADKIWCVAAALQHRRGSRAVVLRWRRVRLCWDGGAPECEC